MRSGDRPHRSGDVPPYIGPHWPAPAGVGAATTTRGRGCSRPPYHHANLALDVGDNPEAVRANRARLVQRLDLPEAPRWLRQVHGIQVVDADTAAQPVAADACVSTRPGRVCAVLTADCLPVLLCDRAGTRIGVAHAGWRGLAGGILEATTAALECAPETLLAWLGPAIGPEAYEVGDEVRAAFLAADPAAETAFQPSPRGRWLADLYRLARQRLARAGVEAVYGGGYCTHRDTQWFFSHRRDGGCTGRMATLIWLEAR